MERQHLPISYQIIRHLDLKALEIIASHVIKQSFPVIQSIADDPMDLHEHLAGEINKMWDSINPDQIAYIIKADSEKEIDDPESIDYFYGLSIEDVILDCIYGFLQEDLEEILEECLGPGENYGYNLMIKTHDDEFVERNIKKMMSFIDENENNDSCILFNNDPYSDDEYDDDEEDDGEEMITRTLSDNVWQERHFIKGYVLEVTGKKASVYKDENGTERLIIPKIISLLSKVKKAKVGCWYQHMVDWKYRLVKEPKTENAKSCIEK